MKLRRLLLAAGAMGLGLAGGLVLAGRLSMAQSSQARPAEQAAARSPLSATASPLPDLSSVAERALKVSANITSTAVVPINNEILRMMYGNLSQQSQSLGSGVIVDSNGIILTNNHVVQDPRASIRVMLPDGREVPGKVLGVDDVSDLAVVQVAEKNLDTLPWGDSSKLKAAEWVLAIGNPFQLSGTVTLGIISTPNRSGEQMGSTSDFIQTDAAINPGNSGGALVNARGELIGINTMIISDSGGSQGLGFAIPANAAKNIMKELIDHGEVTWGSIGRIVWGQVTQAQARYYNLGDAAGLYVRGVETQSPAFGAGLRGGDFVIRMNGQPVTDPQVVGRTVMRAPIGSKLAFDVLRNGRTVSLQIPIVKR